ncbi:hypothetical protein CABS01_05336 [Colletotrichum abscissum]|uniref:uncharacterized protein n=1 Tax=Colletotrichum abscissum TaxID=1671311 RepID=UPI0027D5FDB6|nr:uncharacterized protein CABS01_05336 [Colletotrichum abscissum]KAK1523715.1 hypothetical protein CABS01_05336 [Colletotrichum abscissum]
MCFSPRPASHLTMRVYLAKSELQHERRKLFKGLKSWNNALKRADPPPLIRLGNPPQAEAGA